jgi:hypothetical protein
MTKLEAPYWIATDGLPGLDFNRCIIEPGTNEAHPNGAVGIYVDDDFCAVAALPLEKWRGVPIEDIVAEFWPHYLQEATYAPDHGTVEQRIHFLEIEVENGCKRTRMAEDALSTLRAEHERLKAGRTDLTSRRRTRVEHVNGYFIAQYEHLLTATAHEAVPREDAAGICSICGLYVSDRIHGEHWIAKKTSGHAPAMEWIGELDDDR